MNYSDKKFFLLILCFVRAFFSSRKSFTLLISKRFRCRFSMFPNAAGSFLHFNKSNLFIIRQKLPFSLLLLSFFFFWVFKNPSIVQDSSVTIVCYSWAWFFLTTSTSFLFCLATNWALFWIAVSALLLITKTFLDLKVLEIWNNQDYLFLYLVIGCCTWKIKTRPLEAR